jgi:hypothetical protein
MRSTAYKSKSLLIGGPLLSKNLVFFTYVSPHTKTQGAPDRRSLTQQKLMIFTCVAPHTKSEGLSIGGHLLSKNVGFLHV